MKIRPRFSEKKAGFFVSGVCKPDRWQKARPDPDFFPNRKYMTAPVEMNAANANLSYALDILRNDYSTIMQGVLRGNYAFWVGSAISREKVPDLKDLIFDLLCKLFDCINFSDAECPYCQTFNNIIQLTSLRHRINQSTRPSSWDRIDKDSILDQLHDNYSKVFDHDIRVNGQTISLAWDFLRLHELYGNPSIEPAVDHWLLALLIAERTIPIIISTNWDDLLEKAYEVCVQEPQSQLRVIASTDDLMMGGASTRTILFKIHGCARKMQSDPSQYRDFMIINRSDILAWSGAQYIPFRDFLRTYLRTHLAIFVGLSGQDLNLQMECFQASLDGNFPFSPPKVIFADSNLSVNQRSIFKALYGETEYSENAETIDINSLLQLYAKPLLGALYVLTLFEKARKFLVLGNEDFEEEQKIFVEYWITKSEEHICEHYDAITDKSILWKQLASELPSYLTRFLKMYRDQSIPNHQDEYQPLYYRNIADMEENLDIRDLNYHWLFFTCALFFEGEVQNLWRSKIPLMANSNQGQLTIELNGQSYRLFILRDINGIAKLVNAGIIDPSNDRDVIIAYPHGLEPIANRRTPQRSLPGVTPTSCIMEIWIQNLANEQLAPRDMIRELSFKMLPMRI